MVCSFSLFWRSLTSNVETSNKNNLYPSTQWGYMFAKPRGTIVAGNLILKPGRQWWCDESSLRTLKAQKWPFNIVFEKWEIKNLLYTKRLNPDLKKKKKKKIKILILNFGQALDLFILETMALPRHARNDPKHMSPFFWVCLWQKCFYGSA